MPGRRPIRRLAGYDARKDASRGAGGRYPPIFLTMTRPIYESLRNTDTVELDHLYEEKNSHAIQRRRRLLPWLVHAMLLGVSALLCLVSFQYARDAQHCARRVSAFSPAVEAVEYLDVRFNGTLHKPSVSKGEPSPELDAAWNSIIFNMKPLQISSETLAKLGKDKRPSLTRLPGEYGGEYLVSMEITHHLHCLNMLRKYLDYDYYKATDVAMQADPVSYRMHLDHCVDILRQQLLCNADTGFITYDWVKGKDIPFPDFNTWHKCKNIDKIVAWNHQHEVRIPYGRLARTEGVVDLEETP